MTDHELFALDKIGLIPGPGEDEDSFLTRVALTKEKFKGGEWIPESHWDWVREYLERMFNVKPLYICAFYSNRGLAPWQGAASWIDGRVLHSVQLRKGSRWVKREEVLAHEAIHAARSGFNESRYEEFFAYMTSEKRWRRVLGPILQRPWEAWPLLGALVGGILWPACYLGAAVWTGLGFIRLIRGHRRLGKAAARFKDFRMARAVLLRLTDREIEAFAEGGNIEAYAQGQTCLRWRIIRNYLRW